MVYTPLLKDTQSVSVFRVGSERAVYPNDYVIYDILPLRVKEDSWMTLNIFARELVELGNPNPLPQPYQTVLSQGYRNTQIRALISIENEETLVGIGAGCRISIPSNMEVVVKIAVPAVPRNTYPFPLWGTNPSGVIVQFAGPFPVFPTSPFPMQPIGPEQAVLPAFTTNITAVATPCRPPVSGRLARLSQEVWTARDPNFGPAWFATIPIPSRARKVSVYDGFTDVFPVAPAVYSHFQRAVFIEGDDFTAATPDLVSIASFNNRTMVHDFTVPTNATHLTLVGQEPGEIPGPAKLNVTWTLEL